METDGGTKIYCPHCEAVNKCKAISLTKEDFPEMSSNQRLKVDGDITLFRRGRECLSCYQTFTTIEIHEGLLAELYELRSSLGTVKDDVERSARSVKETLSALSKLSKSLKGL